MAYRRGDSDGFRGLDCWDGLGGGFGWQAHPGERDARTSHAVACAEGVWLLDPLDAPGLDDRIAEPGKVAGVAVCSEYHARDAGDFARRHDVPVTVPAWFSRVQARARSLWPWPGCLRGRGCGRPGNPRGGSPAVPAGTGCELSRRTARDACCTSGVTYSVNSPTVQDIPRLFPSGGTTDGH